MLTNTVSVIPGLLRGKSRIALAVTEPDAGSDVAGLQTEATISDDGRHLIVNGQKKVSMPTYETVFDLGNIGLLTTHRSLVD